jgi:RNA polymerase sigma-70 factor (ECF subfamily)
MSVTDQINCPEAVRFYEQLFLDYYSFLFSFIMRRVQDRSHSEDIAQETFLSAWDSIDVLRDHPNPCGWLITTARNKRLHHFREVNQLEEAMDGLKCSCIETSEAEDDPLALFSDLKPEDAEILTLFYIHGYSTREIAKILEMRETSVRSRLARARKRLEKSVTDRNLLNKIFVTCNILMFFWNI